MTIIYDPDGRPGALNALVQSIDGRVFIRSAAHYSGPEKGAEVVYTASDRIAADYEARGVEVRPLGSEEEEAPQDGIIPKGGSWYAIVIGGEEVDSTQGEDAALERYEELTAGQKGESESNNTE